MNPMNPIRIMTWLAAAHAFAAGLVARPAEIIPVTMQLDWKPNVQFAGLVVALEKGYYRDAGLDVRLRPVDSGMKVVEAVEAGTNWLGCSESGVLLGARARGARIKAVGTMLQGSPFCLMSPKAKGIRKPADLAGRTLGVHPDADLALNVVLASAGVARSSMRTIDVAHSTDPLTSGQVDTLMGYLIDEVVALETAGHAIDVIRGHEHGYVAYSQVYFASERTLAQAPGVVRAFLEASRRGWAEAARDPEAAVQLVLRKHQPDADPEYQRRSLREILVLAQLEGGPGSFGQMSPKTWSRMVKVFNDAKVLPRSVTAEEMVDPQFQPTPSRRP
jgi:ABC-type nitrate/sulfonate/bicarbonate transport system substrate-binding protein